LRPNKLEGLKVPLVAILLKILDIFAQLLELIETLAYFHQDAFLPVLSILKVAKGLLFEVTVDKKTLYFTELGEQTLKLLIIVFFYCNTLLPHCS